MTAALLSKNKERQSIEMKKKLLVKTSALACSLAIVFSCATFTSLAQKDYTVEEKVTISNPESVDVATLYNYNGNKKNLTNDGQSFKKSGNTVVQKSRNNFQATLGILAEINGTDLTNIKADEWSYTMTADIPVSGKVSNFGYLNSWGKIASTVKNEDGVYTVTDGDAQYSVIASSIIEDNGYYRMVFEKSLKSLIGREVGGTITVTDAKAEISTSLPDSNISFKNPYNIYWNSNPTVKVEYKNNNDGTHTYTVTALNVFTKNGDNSFTAIDGGKILKQTVVADDSEANTGYVLLGSGYSYGQNTAITFSDFSVSYTVDKDITEDCIAVLSAGNGIYEEFGDTLGDLVITNSNLAEVNANLAALEASYNGASESVKTAVDAKDFSKKLAYYKNYADAVAKTAHAELLGVQLKNESSVEASDLRFVVKYEANTASGYIVSSYGAVVVPNQVRGNNPDLTRKIDVVSGKEDYFVDVNVKSETVTVDGDNCFYVNVTNSKGKPGLLFDCRPYVVYTNGTDEFTVYADNAVADTDVTEGQATKCALFAAKKLSESITSKLGTDVTYPDGFDSTSYPAIIEKINKLETGDTSLGKTTAEEKKAVFAFVAMNYDAYKA